VIIGGLIIFIYLYGKAKNNYVTFGDLFSYGFKTTTMMTLVFVVFIVIIALTFPEFKTKAIESARAEMERQKQLTDTDIDKGMNLMTKYFWPFMIGATVLGFVIVGAIGSLLGAAVTKKRPVNPIDQLDR
jgi:NADH:ubiquinone oxidoreductase subunit 6 (subunit J)